MKDLYEILGIDKSADNHEIRSAYKLKARSTHPDKVGGSTEAFQELNEAYSVLRDIGKRKKYDAGESLEELSTMGQLATARLAALFQQEIQTAGDHDDLIESIRHAVASQSLILHTQVDQINAEIKKYKHVADRVIYKGDKNDIFAGQINLSIEAMRHQVSTITEEIEVMKVVINMLNDYECSVKEREPAHAYRPGDGIYSGYPAGQFGMPGS